MKSSAQTSALERLGHMLGRGWRTYVRQEQKVNGWLVAHGVPAGIAKAALLALKLIVFGVLLYTVFWPALLLVCVVAAAPVVGGKSSDEDEPEWRMGLSGYGLYRGETRIDPGSLDDN